MTPANDISVPAGFPSPSTAMSLLGVDYFHLKTGDGGDLYLTRFGLPFWKNLLPENWYAREWFEAKRERLEGTSMVYKVPTRPVDGRVLHLVVKWSRVGEVVPLDTLTVNKFIHAEFNSPFEEFSLLMELRQGELGPRGHPHPHAMPAGHLRAGRADAALANGPFRGQNPREGGAASRRGN